MSVAVAAPAPQEPIDVGAHTRLYDQIRKDALHQANWWELRNPLQVAEDVALGVSEGYIQTARFDRLAQELKAKKPGAKAVVWKSVRHELIKEVHRQKRWDARFRPYDESDGEGDE